MSGPLDGIRVLDLTHVLNGPFATMLLAHMGAEVLKIEHGQGDLFRRLWTAPDADRDAYEFLAVNANKECITLNLKHAEGRRMFLRLVRDADVVVENLSLGAMDRLGLSFEALRAVNPRIILAASKGYGESGPYASSAAFANTIMAITGWIDAVWDWSGAAGTAAYGVADEVAGMSLALGICGALYAREHSGVGQRIEVSMQEAQLGFLVSRLHEHFEGQRVGGAYHRCADGYMAFHAGGLSDGVWSRLTTALGHPDGATDTRFATAADRDRNLRALNVEMSSWIAGLTRQELWDVLRANGLASAPILSVGEAIEDPHLVAREGFVEVEHPAAGRVKLLAPWIRFSETPTRLTHAGAAVGEHNAAVYGRLLGLSEDDLARLRAEGAI
jgi:crotonobetainyl-CoA:carnitine CoA-transferase CaiB-like acyl-CoA transferase